MQICQVAERIPKEDIVQTRLRYQTPNTFSRRLRGGHYTESFDLKSVEIELSQQDVSVLRNAVATLNQFRNLTILSDFRGAIEEIKQDHPVST